MQYKIEKNLVGLEDVIIGVNKKVKQTRGTREIEITGLPFIGIVNNFTELAKYDSLTYPLVLVKGGSKVNDGLGGIFYLDATSTANASDDVVIPEDDNGRWTRLKLLGINYAIQPNEE